MSSKEVEVNTSGGIGIGGLLFVAFVILKVTGVVSFSWVWVCSPLWIPLVLFLTVIVVVMLVALIGQWLKG